MLIDSHAHIDDEKFDQDRQAVLDRAQAAGLEYIINPGADEASSLAAIKLSQKHPMVYAAVGIHPHDAKNYDFAKHRQLFSSWAAKDKVVAIGEIGLDYYYDHSPRGIQQKVFIDQIAIAKEAKLPIIIHNRESMADMQAILQEHFSKEFGGVMHSYSGSVEMAEIFLEMGFYLSAGGPLTFKNARKLPQVIEMIPLDRLLIETDSPYLTPTPHRGKRNEPAHVYYVAKEVARIRKLDLDEVAAITTANAKKLFNLP